MAMRKVILSGLVVWAGTILAVVSPSNGQTPFCNVGEAQAAGGSCEQGMCDNPGERDLWAPGASTSPLQIQLKFIVFCNDAGGNCTATQQLIDNQLDVLNDVFNEDYKIEFVAASPLAVFENSTRYRNLCSNPQVTCVGPNDEYSCPDATGTEVLALKEDFSDNPNGQLNIYVVDTTYAPFVGQAYFPWCDNPTGVMRGIIIDDGRIGGALDCAGYTAPCRTLVHEIGHTLGLWHPNRGTNEVVSQLPACCELALCDGSCSNPICDSVGDFCCDTRSSSPGVACYQQFGQDCNGASVSSSDPSLYMNNGNDNCWDSFTPQQSARMQCWTCDSVTGWLSDDDSGACCRPDDTCQDTSETCCDNIGGSFVAGTTCSANGACCLPNGTCSTGSACDCADAGGSFSEGTTCSTGSCCMPDGSCSVESEACCVDAGGSFNGSGSTCNPTRTCCVGDGSCIRTSPTCCASLGGQSQPRNTPACESGTGACCLAPYGCCTEGVSQSWCATANGDYFVNETCVQILCTGTK